MFYSFPAVLVDYDGPTFIVEKRTWGGFQFENNIQACKIIKATVTTYDSVFALTHSTTLMLTAS